MSFWEVLVTAFVVAMLLIPLQIRKFRDRDMVVPDYYKNSVRYVPTSGGLSILLAFYSAVFLAILGAFSAQITLPELVSAFIIALYGLFGLLDDLIDIGRATKVVFPPVFTLPIAFVASKAEVPLIGEVGGLLLFIIAPVYVMVVANLVNMHSGFNGMASGLTAILLAFLLLKSLTSGKGSTLISSAMLGALLAFLYFNWYPSKIFDGNVGAFTMGSTVGLAIVLGGFYVSGFVMLLPHTANFLLYVYWRLMRKIKPHDERYKIVKFGKVRKDKSIEAPNPYTLKWVLPYYFKMTEKQVVLSMYALTTVFCVIGFFVPY